MSDNWERIDIGLTDMIDWNETKELQGTYIESRDNVGKNSSKIYTVEKGDGSKISFWGSVVLDNKFKAIELGDFVKIVYLGEVEGANSPKPYKNFDVFVKRS